MKILVVWIGSFGFALSKYLADTKNVDISIYDKKLDCLNCIKNNCKHPFFFENKKITNIHNIHIIDTLKSGNIRDFDVVFLVCTSEAVKYVLKDMKNYIKNWTILINMNKWLDTEYKTNVYNVVKEIFSEKSYSYMALSWWMFSNDWIDSNFMWADLACENIEDWQKIKSLLESDFFDINLIGWQIDQIEWNGIIKNVIATAIWYFQWKWDSLSTMWAEIVKLLTEIKVVLSEIWLKNCFDSLEYSWMWDFITTCFWNSRNREFGEIIWQWKSLTQAIDVMQQQNKTVESLSIYKILSNMIAWKEQNFPILYNFCNLMT